MTIVGMRMYMVSCSGLDTSAITPFLDMEEANEAMRVLYDVSINVFALGFVCFSF